MITKAKRADGKGEAEGYYVGDNKVILKEDRDIHIGLTSAFYVMHEINP